jgi:hypothetical protein
VANKTDYACELNTTNVTLSTEVMTEDINGTAGIVVVESTLSTEIVDMGNETQSELPVDTTTSKSDIQTTQHPETTMEPVLPTVEMVAEARPVSSEICSCDLEVSTL